MILSALIRKLVANAIVLSVTQQSPFNPATDRDREFLLDLRFVFSD